MSDTKALEILEKEDGTYLSIQGKRYSAMILLGHSEMAHNAILELAAELAGLKEQIEVMKGAKEIIDQLRADNERLTDGWMVYESISPDGELRPDISALLRDLDQLRAELDETRAWEAFHPRAIKLLRKRKNFIVIADDEPYFIKAYMMISNHEHSKGTWTEEDEERFRAAFIKRSDEKIAEMFGDVSHPEEPK